MKHIFIFLFLLPFSLLAQNQAYLGREDTDTIPERFRLESNVVRDHIYAKLPQALKVNGKSDRRCFLYAQEQSVVIAQFISSGALYSDWSELENYLNRILRRIMPESLKGDSTIHLYIAQDGYNNAFMTPSGHMIVNIGFIAEASSEAMIAATLLHELAHYYKQHGVYTYLESVKSSYGEWHYYNSKKYQKNSISSETNADSLAMDWMLASGYSLNGMKQFFETDSLANANEIARSKDLWKIEEVTHPLSEVRLKAVQNFLNKHPEHAGSMYLEDEQLFMQFRADARIESLKHLMHSMEYYECVEQAFKYHLFEPGNAGYMYYLMESIRRQCYLNRKIWNENFITNRYYVRDSTSNRGEKKRMAEHLFKTYNPKILTIPDSDTSLIRTQRYWKGDPDFTTYEQAFVYFYNLSQLQQMHEAVLSNALSLSHNKALRDKFLKKYLGYQNIRYREFAESLLVDSLYASLDTTKRLMVLVNFVTTSRVSKEELLISRQPADTADHIQEILTKTVGEFPGWEAVDLKKLAYDHASDARLLNKMYAFSQFSTVSVGGQIELALLDPSIWEQFRKHHISQMEFFACYYIDPGDLNNSITTYQSKITQGNTPLFYPPARKRYMEMQITSLKMTDSGQMKRRRHYSTHFGNIKVSVPEVAKELAAQVREKDKQKIGDYYLILND